MSDRAVSDARTPLTMHLAPFDILLNLEVEFKKGISADEQIEAVERIEKAIREKYPSIKRIFIEARRPAASGLNADHDACARSARAARAKPS
jgi:hypothetical protein